MKRIPLLIRGITQPMRYPGYRGGNGCVENLCTYRQDVELWDDSGAIKDDGLAFDIERQIAWDEELRLAPFAYSMMIDGSYPVKRPRRLRVSHPTTAEFSEAIEGLGEFKLDETVTAAIHGLHQYVNPNANILVNWGVVETRISPPKICIGVIQREPIASLKEVTDEITPYAVAVFNALSPTWQISREAIDQSVKVARESDKIIPIKRQF